MSFLMDFFRSAHGINDLVAIRPQRGGGCPPSCAECERKFLEDSLLANSPTIFITISNVVY